MGDGAAAARMGACGRSGCRRPHRTSGGVSANVKPRVGPGKFTVANRKIARAFRRATATPVAGEPSSTTDVSSNEGRSGNEMWSEEWFFNAYERCKGDDTVAGALSSFQSRCRSALAGAHFPSRREEAYRFTDLSQLNDSECAAPRGAALERVAQAVESVATTESDTLRLVVVDGVFSPSISQMDGLDDSVFVGSTRSYNEDATVLKLSEGYGSVQSAMNTETVFGLLNGACASDVILIDVAPGVEVRNPIQIVYVSNGADRDGVGGGAPLSTSFPRVSIQVGSGAKCKVFETFASVPGQGDDEATHFCCPVLEIALAKDAELLHDYTQQSSRKAFHIRQTCVEQAERSGYHFTGVDTGSSLARHNLFVGQAGRETDTTLHSFAMVSSDQLIDLHSDIDLNHPSGTTDQLHKCIVAHASSRGVFDGSVHVRKPAQQTDAGQLCRSLLLSRKATVNVKPNLQIHADDVKCTHGATISDLEEDQLFYLRSRGVSEEDARKTLVYSFGLEVVGRLSSESTRKKLAAVLADMCEKSDIM